MPDGPTRCEAGSRRKTTDVRNGAVMTTAITLTDTRELDHRAADGVEVSLLWHADSDFLSVVVSDTRAGEAFELVLDDRDDALDVFHHPYAYAAYRGLDFGHAERDDELVAA
jgi:hypothetical protein